MIAPREQAPAPRLLVANVLLALGSAALPLSVHLPVGISVFFFAMLLLRLSLLARSAPPLPKPILIALAGAGLALALTHYQHIFEREAGTGLLTVMLGLKLLELHSRRDLQVTVLLGFFFLVTQFLYLQSLAMTGYLVLITLWVTATLIELHRAQPSRTPLQPLRLALLLLAQATPIMLVLFLLFPRLSTPLWSLYDPSAGGMSGFSDQLEPGSVSELSLSQEIAFRVDFHGPVPVSRQRYWRGQVFTDTDGRKWLPRGAPFVHERQLAPPAVGGALDYTVTLEPHGRHWMFALEMPSRIPPGSRMSEDFQLLSLAPLRERLQYRMRSYPSLHSPELAPQLRARTLAVPDSVTPRMRRLVDAWTARTADPGEVVKQALLHFREQEFVYTLAPPRVVDNPTDQFLFETRRGFCEHYATSFALLMRLAGIPSRVVTGYQGGEYNPHGDYLIVRQSDAHAWAEVWVEDQGWVRVDPTAAVAPERVEQWFDPRGLRAGTPIRFGLAESALLRRLTHQAGLILDALNTGWRKWVLHYGAEKRSSLLESLGLGFLRRERLGIALVGVSMLLLAPMAWLLLRQDRVPLDPVQKLYLRLCARLARRGLPRRPSEGPRDYGDRVLRQRPELETQLLPIVALYLKLRYGKSGSAQERQRLRRLIGNFHP